MADSLYGVPMAASAAVTEIRNNTEIYLDGSMHRAHHTTTREIRAGNIPANYKRGASYNVFDTLIQGTKIRTQRRWSFFQYYLGQSTHGAVPPG
jgi:hypothetical protein